MADPKDLEELVLRQIPDQVPGNQFEVTADQKIGLARSGVATESDLAEIGELKTTLLEALGDLLDATVNSNAFKQLHTVATRYKAALDQPKPSIDGLFGQGLRFETFIAKLRAEIAKGDLPDADLPIAEALDSVVALNGTIILSTQRGQILVQRSNDYARTQAEATKLKAHLQRLNEAVQAERKLFTQEAKEAIDQAIANAGLGKHPERTNTWAESTGSNFLALLSKVALKVGTPIFAGAFALSEPGQAAMQALVPLINQTSAFLMANAPIVRDLAAIGGQHFRYLPSLLAVLKSYGTPEEMPAVVPEQPFDLEEAHEMILRGEAPPAAWVLLITKLDFSDTKLDDLSPLAGLVALEHLDLNRTEVSDLSPLADLVALQHLHLDFTQVSDLSPLAGLVTLQGLLLGHTQVSDLSPIAGLFALEILYLRDTQVSDLSPLAGLIALQQLYLANTRVSSLSPLSSLIAMQLLDVSGTEISDLSPIAGLITLQHLDLSGTVVSDLSPMAGLITLQHLNLNVTEVSDVAALAGFVSLQMLTLAATKVSDLTPLSGLVGLRELNLNYTQVSNLAPLIGLGALQRIYLDGTRVINASALAHLQKLEVHGLPV
jgi:Leucine-rich repeat (LRR) protein